MTDDAAKAPKKSRFAAAARRPGGLTLDDAVARAETSITAMADEYQDWLRKDLATLEQAVDRARATQGQDEEAMAELYWRARTLRDLGTTFGQPLVTVIADKLCELVHRLRHGRIYAGDAVQTHLDALRLASQPLHAGRAPADAGPLLDGLSAIVAKFPAAGNTLQG